MIGYARFHRSLIGHPAFRNDAESMAFAYLVLKAAWKPVRVRYKGRPIQLDRGQLAVSVRDLAEAMDRGKGWVERLLTRLKSETMVETRSETGVLVITICNYDKYQSSNDDGETVDETQGETDAGQTQDTEQEDKENKEERTTSGGYGFAGEVIRLKQADLDRWQRNFPDLDLRARLEARDVWLAQDADEQTRKRWFQSTASYLANLQEKAGARAREPATVGFQI